MGLLSSRVRGAVASGRASHPPDSHRVSRGAIPLAPRIVTRPWPLAALTRHLYHRCGDRRSRRSSRHEADRGRRHRGSLRRVVARAFDDHEVPAEWRASIAQLFVTIGREYRVWAVRIPHSGPCVLIVDDTREPRLYPAWCFFLVSDGALPDDWVLTLEQDADALPVTMLGPHAFPDQSAIGALLEFDPDRRRAFWDMVDDVHRGDVRAALERLSEAGYPDPVVDSPGLVFHAFELEQVARGYLGSGTLDEAAIPAPGRRDRRRHRPAARSGRFTWCRGGVPRCGHRAPCRPAPSLVALGIA